MIRMKWKDPYQEPGHGRSARPPLSSVGPTGTL